MPESLCLGPSSQQMRILVLILDSVFSTTSLLRVGLLQLFLEAIPGGAGLALPALRLREGDANEAQCCVLLLLGFFFFAL